MNALIRLALGFGAGVVAFGAVGSCSEATNQDRPPYGIYLCGDSPDGRLRVVDDSAILGGLTEDFPAAYAYDASTHLLTIAPNPAEPGERPTLWLNADEHIFELRYVPGGASEAQHAGPGLIASGERMTGIDFEAGGLPAFEPFSDLWCPYRG